MISLPNMKSLSYVDRHRLPAIPAIYVVFDGVVVLYVGQSICLRNRWLSHHKRHQIHAYGTQVQIAWVQTSVLTLRKMERLYIAQLKPLWNGKDAPFNNLRRVHLNLGDALYKWRSMSGVQLNETASQIGVSMGALCKIEGGYAKPSGKNLMKIFNWLMRPTKEER